MPATRAGRLLAGAVTGWLSVVGRVLGRVLREAFRDSIGSRRSVDQAFARVGLVRPTPGLGDGRRVRQIHFVGLGGGGILVSRRSLLGVLLLEDGIADDLLVDDILKLETGHLQQLDGLLQSRRHDETLGKS